MNKSIYLDECCNNDFLYDWFGKYIYLPTYLVCYESKTKYREKKIYVCFKSGL